MHLKGVVLWWNLVCEELVEDRDLLHDVVAHLGDLCEEEESEEAGCATETAGKDTVLHERVDGDAVVVLCNLVLWTKRTLIRLIRAAHASGRGRLAVVREGCG